jgi:hypothetical protein
LLAVSPSMTYHLTVRHNKVERNPVHGVRREP